ncbi:MAG TPA: PKD domain-containing protein [Bacteroidia bacterium]|nr:PKD domain-containing protein [Bacteroidia bacterium]HNT80697.1 PKD domain-containing protein [Bacteroidia bacterium]
MRSIKLYFLILFICFGNALKAQVQNDSCLFSQLISIPVDGDTCILSTTLTATADNIWNVCDSITLGPIPPGGNEVWFTFIASGTNNIITISPTGVSPASLLSATLYNAGCASAYTACANAPMPAGSAILNYTGTVGNQLWVSVSALAADGDFEICIRSFTPPVIPSLGQGDSCNTAIELCSKQPFRSPGPSFGNAGNGPIPCFPFGPQNIIWYEFTVGSAGTLEWTADPPAPYELDWALFDISAGCPGTLVACNFAVTAGGGAPTGMLSTSVNPCGAVSQICTPVAVTAGSKYALQFNVENFLISGIDTPYFDLNWGGTFEMAPYADFSMSLSGGCDTITASFINLSVGASGSIWDFGNGSAAFVANPPPVIYTQPGTYVVSLEAISTSACSNIVTQQVTVAGAPTNIFSADTLICQSDTSTIIYSGVPNASFTYNWNFGSANVISGTLGSSGPFELQWPSSGSYPISLQVIDPSSGCSSSVFVRNIQVVNAPDSTFSIAGFACQNDSINVTYTGTPIVGANYNWNFAGANVLSGSGQGPYIISFPFAGFYNVGLTVDVNGCTSSSTQSVFVNVAPLAYAGLDLNICSGASDSLGFNAIPGYSYLWSPSVGLSDSTAAKPEILIYNTSGQNDTLTYYLSVSQGTCSSEDTVVVIVRPAPTSQFTSSSDTLCIGSIAIINYSGNAGVSAVFNWNFGNAIVSGGGSIYNLNWPSAQQDSILLTVSENGCSSDTSKINFLILDKPVADAGINQNVCSEDTIYLGAAAQAGLDYLWFPTFGLNDSTISNPFLILSNTSAGNDSIYYYVNVSNAACSSTDSVQIIVKPKQLAGISAPTSVCLDNNTVSINTNSSIVPGSTFDWSFGSSASPASYSGSTPGNVTFNSIGIHTITLICSTPNCPNDTAIALIEIFEEPQASFFQDISFGCSPLEVSFTNTSIADPGSIYFWDFGNGNNSMNQNPNPIIYNSGGVYDVSLIVTSSNNCVDTFSVANAVSAYSSPIANAIAQPAVVSALNPLVQFINQSISFDSCFYDFGDGTVSYDCNPYHAYSDTGTYQVMMVALSGNGCNDTLWLTVQVNAFYTFYIPNTFTPNDDGKNDYFQISGYGFKDFSIKVFNRWGQQVFESSDPLFVWDGTDGNGNDLMDGVYTYRIFLREMTGKKHNKFGRVNILR